MECRPELYCLLFIGDGKYAYLKASFPRQHGDIVRLISPKMQGAKCMSIMYHMYGSSMGSLIIYMKMNGSETVEWIKSGNHPDQWFEAAVFFNSSAEYKVSRVFQIYDCCRSLNFFRLSFLNSAKVAYVTEMIFYSFPPLVPVPIYDFHVFVVS